MAELEFEAHKMALWKDVCLAVVATESCLDKDTAAKYATAAVDAFDLKFRHSFVAIRQLLDLEMFGDDDELEIMN